MKKAFKVSVLIIFIFNAFSCNDDPEVSATIDTFEAVNVGATVATVIGEIGGNSIITARGVCYAKQSAPTIADNKVETLTSGNGIFNVELSGLEANKLYYARAFASTDAGVVYGNEISFNTGSAGVYVGGQNAGKAVFWNNETQFDLWGYESTASSGVVYGKDTYFVGKVYNGDRNSYSFVYWKSGAPTVVLDLTSSNINSTIDGVAISGSDVHIVWTEVNTETKTGVIKYWKNGKYGSITDGTQNAKANSIAVYGNDVYIAGTESNGSYTFATYWKNGSSIPLTIGKTNGEANSVYVYNNDVYVAGTESTSSDPNLNKTVAKYWRNGAPTSLSDGTKNASAKSVFVNSNGVYVAGMEQTASDKTVAKYWKNGIASSLTDGTMQASTAQIVASDNDVYVLGKEGTMGTVWKNGARLAPFDGNDPAVFPLCISVSK